MFELIRQSLALAGVALAAIACPGCATGDSPKVEDDVTALKRQVWTLEKRVSELALRVSYQAGDIAQLKAAPQPTETEPEPPKMVASVAPKEESGINFRGEAPPPVTPEPAVKPEPKKETPPVAERDVASAEEDAPPSAEPMMVAANESSDFNGQSAEEVYRMATIAFNEQDYGLAVTGFDYLIRAFPGHPLSPFSQYWIGESYYVRKRYSQAWEAYQKLILRWPDAPKAPDALLKSGLSKLGMGERDEGKATLEKLIRDYPRTPAAFNARRTLDELGDKSNG